MTNKKKRETELPDRIELPALAVRDMVVFPHMMAPLFMGRDKSIRAAELAVSGEDSLVLLLALEGLDFITTFSAAASCFNNIGPGLELVGPMSNYTCFSPFGKLLLSFAMLFGRLELYPMLLLFIPAAWRK